MKIIFMGTPDFAVPVLESLVNSDHEVTAVYTQPDKEKGRGKKVLFSPVKEYALSKEIPVYQPKRIRNEEEVETLRNIEADAIVVAAYGQILSSEILSMKKYGCINVHASLLPAYRGAAPITWAMVNGEKETGITIMQMDEGLDTGDILLQEAVEILDTDSLEDLENKMTAVGGSLLLQALVKAEEGTLKPVPQGESTTEYARMIQKADGKIDFSESAALILRKIKAFDPWPSAYTYLNGKMVKIFDGVLEAAEEGKTEVPGAIVNITKKSFCIQCRDGRILVKDLQLEGKKRMNVQSFLQGVHLEEGMKFENE